MSKARTTPAENHPASYEAAMAELENLIAQMESGELPLETSISTYQRGTVLIKYCQQILEKIDQQVQILEADDQLTPLSSSLPPLSSAPSSSSLSSPTATAASPAKRDSDLK